MRTGENGKHLADYKLKERCIKTQCFFYISFVSVQYLCLMAKSERLNLFCNSNYFYSKALMIHTKKSLWLK
ncbi:hypothetical protein HZS_6377 [Henneguya salminicola]|nr:hypothetical protein HZS_6377 [Henneguya salminicola]